LNCDRHSCLLGGCRKWRARWPDAKTYAVVDGKRVEVPFAVCRMCREHEAECR
jgi:hypothetical protein